jgi:hypothetical protein
MNHITAIILVTIGLVTGFLMGTQVERIVNERTYTFQIDGKSVELTKGAVIELRSKHIIVNDLED